MFTRRRFTRLLPFLGALPIPLLGKPRPPLPEGHEILKSFDARDWAKAFVAHVHQYPGIPTDEATMTGWFANALMRGFDEARVTPATRAQGHRIAELTAQNDFLVDKNSQLAVENEWLRDYQDRVEGALV